jgi:beta-N-acetylhexosaminidase
MTDDLSMKALSGDFGELASQSLAAGCDLVLHCNGDMAEMQAIAATTHGKATAELYERLATLVATTDVPPDDASALLAEYQELAEQYSLAA